MAERKSKSPAKPQKAPKNIDSLSFTNFFFDTQRKSPLLRFPQEPHNRLHLRPEKHMPARIVAEGTKLKKETSTFNEQKERSKNKNVPSWRFSRTGREPHFSFFSTKQIGMCSGTSKEEQEFFIILLPDK